MKTKSSSLFYFTKRMDLVNSILRNGFYPRYCLEDIRCLREYQDYLLYPMVCFCDIPISRIAEHTAFYGEYGLGLINEWGLKNGLLPVIYMLVSSLISSLKDLSTYTSLSIRPSAQTERKREGILCVHF
jgi:hypothetical protein